MLDYILVCYLTLDISIYFICSAYFCIIVSFDFLHILFENTEIWSTLLSHLTPGAAARLSGWQGGTGVVSTLEGPTVGGRGRAATAAGT